MPALWVQLRLAEALSLLEVLLGTCLHHLGCIVPVTAYEGSGNCGVTVDRCS